MVNAREAIANSHRVIEVFGERPSFHDAEILSIRLDRRGPSLEAVIYVHSIGPLNADTGYFELLHKSIVTMKFDRIILHEVGDFNHQNVIFGLHIEHVTAGSRKFDVRAEPCYGGDFHLECDAISVVDVKPWVHGD